MLCRRCHKAFGLQLLWQKLEYISDSCGNLMREIMCSSQFVEFGLHVFQSLIVPSKVIDRRTPAMKGSLIGEEEALVIRLWNLSGHRVSRSLIVGIIYTGGR